MMSTRAARSIAALLLASLCACGGADWRQDARTNAEALVRKQLGRPDLVFAHEAVTGDSVSGQTCGEVSRPLYGGGSETIRFIAFIDGADGRNPYLSHPTAPYPGNSADFEMNWRSQCVALGYRR